ncbi:MAG TPA: gephyrin-like molybdotransferase Glp [Actinomycetota bacterium]|nr:gephyrin-like molybdotransferase Glp [Actinomycetota bacterium]
MPTEPLSLDDARKRILDAAPPIASIDLPLAEVQGCVLAREVVGEYDLPPFSAAAADGFAVRAADIFGASEMKPVPLRIAGSVRSGRPPDATVGWGEAVRVVRGAPIPAGADCVVPGGAFRLEGEQVEVVRQLSAGEHIDPAGEDVRAGSVLVPAGRRLSAAEVGLLAAAGHATAVAYPKMRVAVVSVGPTLVEPGRPAAFGQLRDANSFSIVAALREAGTVPYRLPLVRDADAELRELLLSNLSRADAFVCSGAMEDDADIPALLAGVGEIETYRVQMYPGGAIGFGLVEGQPFFSLPAEPVSAFVAFEALVRPVILQMMGRRDLARPEVTAVLDRPIGGPAGLTLFVPARVGRRDGRWHCVPTGPAHPRRLAAVVEANGLVVVPPGDRGLGAGEEVRVQIFRPLDR